ncbi:glycosyltransferase family 39 protein [Aerosakkonemataceae cyanobacterium BLCC-F50]|uniref:Glycosyltransferase family 39 protein n=1 Tax=Floridaenema flaviceps BLCC-F50 TaxID=3153642 RepID=A0ABV4XPR9_9CYAN
MKIKNITFNFFSSYFPQKGLRILIITLLLIGILFRCTNIDTKVYWGDEVFTSWRLAGYTLNEFVQQVSDGKIRTIDELQQYQRIDPEKSVIEPIKVLAVEDCHPPLYYIIAWFWQKTFGDSIAVKRSLSVAISLLIFPCLYLLCRELFASPLVGWIALGLVAVSPIHVLYAQEFRQYSLWTVTILLSGWALLRSMRLQTKSSWLIYAASLLLLLYTHLFSLFVAAGHLIYVLINQGWRWNKKSRNFGLAFLAGVIAFVPWIVAIIINFRGFQEITDWTNQKTSLFSLFKIWLFNLMYTFIDLDNPIILKLSNDWLHLLIKIILGLLIGILVGYSIYFICKHSQQQTWLFVLTLMGVTGISLILPDLIPGGIRSTIPRYLIPCYLGIQLAVAYLIATKISNFKFPGYWRLLLIAILSVSLLSCQISSPAKTWWTKYGSYYNPEVAQIVNQSPNPLVITMPYGPRILALSYLLHPQVHIQFIDETKILKIPNGFSDIFFYRIPQPLLDTLNQQYNNQIKIIYQSPLPSAYYVEPLAQHCQLWLAKLVKR